MYHSARIIAVDDNPDHLAKLESQIKKRGGSCLSVKFEGLESLPDLPIQGIRLIFMDINLIVGASPGAGSRNFSINEAILNQLLQEDNGPYALITWTNTADHNELMNYLNARLNERKRPFFSLSLDKNEYLDNAPALLDALQNLYSSSPQMAALLDWEIRVQNAVSQVLDDLLRLAGGATSAETSENIDNLMSWLARAACGKENAFNDKLSAVNDALSPVLHDKISHIFSETIPNALWDAAVTKIHTATPLTDMQTGRVNLALHISKYIERVQPSDRGAVVLLPVNWLEDDSFKDRFHTEKSVLLQQQLKTTNIVDALNWVMIPYQAACDHAQSQPGPTPMVLGIIRRKHAGRGNTPPKAVWISPVFCDSGGEPYEIVVNCRYMISLNPENMDSSVYQVWGRIRDQLMTDLGNHIHAYGQRPGYIKLPE